MDPILSIVPQRRTAFRCAVVFDDPFFYRSSEMTMSLPIKRIVLTAGLMMAGAGRVLACDVGDIQCDSAGYRYVCACYTSDGCQYYPSGSCTSLRSRPPEIMTRRIVDRGAGAVGPDPIPSR